MGPLVITATLASDIANPTRPPALDALVAYAQCVFVERRPPPDPGKPLPDVDISDVIARSACGRYHLASFALSEVEEWCRGRYINRRFPIAEAQAMGGKIGTLNLTGGAAKSFRIPIETAWLRGDTVTWYAVGDREKIASRLAWITHLGKRRGVGLGRVARWSVEPCESWGESFPVIRDARPLRNLPLDSMDPELAQSFEGYGCVSFPYFERMREELCILAA